MTLTVGHPKCPICVRNRGRDPTGHRQLTRLGLVSQTRAERHAIPIVRNRSQEALRVSIRIRSSDVEARETTRMARQKSRKGIAHTPPGQVAVQRFFRFQLFRFQLFRYRLFRFTCAHGSTHAAGGRAGSDRRTCVAGRTLFTGVPAGGTSTPRDANAVR